MTTNKTILLDSTQIQQKLSRISYQIIEDNISENEIVLIGVSHNGYIMAQTISKIILEISSIQPILVEAKLNKQSPLSQEIWFDKDLAELKNKSIIVVDDVLNSGKTLIYLIATILQFPFSKLRTAILVDRNHKRYPISADFVGMSLSTTLQEHVFVEFEPENIAYLV
jgi:pyrimidine operon attenuation protein / uracil phosphoribosyltransferase